jgi:hypothetical protein
MKLWLPGASGLMIRLERQDFRLLQDERIRRLEVDLGKLERVVDLTITGMRDEHAAMREAMKEGREALAELGRKMEESVSTMADELKKLAEKNAGVDSILLQKGAYAKGAVASAGWIFAAVMTVLALVVAYQANQDPSPLPAESKSQATP